MRRVPKGKVDFIFNSGIDPRSSGLTKSSEVEDTIMGKGVVRHGE